MWFYWNCYICGAVDSHFKSMSIRWDESGLDSNIDLGVVLIATFIFGIVSSRKEEKLKR